MTTTVTKSIGTSSRDYSTIAAWEADAPANLVTADEVWKGECYNDSEFLVTGKITIGGSTSDATRYKWLTAASGQGFADNANKLTNVLCYNQSNGVGVRTTTGYLGGLILLAESYCIITRLQFKNTGSDSANYVAVATAQPFTVNGCIFENGTSGGYRVCSFPGTIQMDNCLIINRRSVATSYGLYVGYAGTAAQIHYVTVVRPNGDGTTGVGIIQDSASPYPIVKNCAVFGFATGFSGTFDSGSGYNATDVSSAPGSNNQTSKTYSAQFQNYANTTRDFRAASGGDLAHGTPESYSGGIDIVGQTRDGATPYIGAWEIVASAHTVALGQDSETDVSQAFSHAKQVALGQVSETDIAQAIQFSGSKIIAFGQISETDAPQIFVSRKQKAFGQPSEADASAILSPGRLYPFTQVSETDVVQAFAKTKRAALSQTDETDAAQPIQAAGTKIIALGQVTETEFAQALAHFKAMGILQASETDDVFAMAASKSKSIGQAQETDAALNFGGTGIPPYEVLATAYQPRTRRAEYEPRVKRIPL